MLVAAELAGCNRFSVCSDGSLDSGRVLRPIDLGIDLRLSDKQLLSEVVTVAFGKRPENKKVPGALGNGFE